MINDTYLVIVNPNAGGGLGAKDWPIIEKLLIESGINFQAVFTQYRRHAIKIVSEYVQKGYTKFIAVGGDGTLNEVVNGMMTHKDGIGELTLGVVMIGTGNDWGKMFNIPKDYTAAIQLITANNIFCQDVGKVSFFLGEKQYERYFINLAGLGFDARVVESANKSKDKGKSSKFSYLFTLFKTLMKYKSLDINVNIEGRPLVGSKLFTMSIGIGKYSGGGMMQVPNALADDGLFDIMIVNHISKGKIIRKIKKLYDGSIEGLKEVDMHRGQHLRIESKDMVMLEVDGESLGHGPFEFMIVDKKLNVIVG